MTTEDHEMPDSAHYHLVTVQDCDTHRESWSAWTNQWTRDEAEQQARQLLGRSPDTHHDDQDDDQAPAWSALWITSCTGPCAWAAPAPGYPWVMPPAGELWWHADSVIPPSHRPTRRVSLMTLVPATADDIALLGLAQADLDAELARLDEDGTR